MTSVARRLGRVVTLNECRPSTEPSATEALSEVLSGRHLAVAYQPIVTRVPAGDHEHWAIDAIEALVRARANNGCVLRPDRLLPAVARAGLMQPLFTFVFAESLNAWCTLRAGGIRVALSVNLHAEALQDDDLPRTILSLLELTGIAPERFTIELTESGPISDLHRASRNLWRLRRHRVRVALDDFGSRFSTQTRLDCLEADEVKIDKALVFGLEQNEEQRRVVEHIVQLAHARGMTVVAEGVETRSCLDLLGSMGVDRAQGFLIGRPQFESQLPVLLRRWGSGEACDVANDHAQLSLPGLEVSQATGGARDRQGAPRMPRGL